MRMERSNNTSEGASEFLILRIVRALSKIGIILIPTECVLCTIHKLLQHVSANTYRYLQGENTKAMFN